MGSLLELLSTLEFHSCLVLALSVIDTAFHTFPQRSYQFLSGPTVSPSQDSAGATVNYDFSAILSNGSQGVQVKAAVQLTVERRGEQFEITAIWPRVLELHPL
jgi:hypothetical protein